MAGTSMLPDHAGETMRHFLFRLAFVAVQLAASLPVHARLAEFCVDPARHWCLGTLTFTAHEARVRVTQFSNDDILVELAEHERTGRMLMRADEKRPSYFGLSQDEQRPGGVGFKFSPEGWAIPLGALALAFPDGLTSVPPTETEKRVDLGGAPLVVTAWRLPDGGIGFRLYKPGFAPPIVAGAFSNARPAPLDEGTISRWGPGVHVEPFVRLKPPPEAQ
jgi:hypothetical protein